MNGGSSLLAYFDYDYTDDPIGNRLTSNVDSANPAMSYTTNDLNQYTATAAPAESFGYDADGNLLSDSPVGPKLAAAKYEYDPYGNTVSATGTYAAANPFRFSTKWFDTETGLSYYEYRYYNVRLGRWMSRDPMGELGGANLYVLLTNDPVNEFDVLGFGKGKVVGWVVRRVGSKLFKTRAIYSEKMAAILFRQGQDVLIRQGKQKAGQVARMVIDEANLLYHPGGAHRLRNGGSSLPHFQDKRIRGRHIFFSIVGLVMANGVEKELKADESGVIVNEIFTNPYPGQSIANGLTVQYWAGKDSWWSVLDWLNPLEVLAIAGDAGRWMDRETSKQFIGVSATVVDCGTPKWTFAFNAEGSLVSVGTWDDKGQMSTVENTEALLEQFTQDDSDVLKLLRSLLTSGTPDPGWQQGQ